MESSFPLQAGSFHGANVDHHIQAHFATKRFACSIALETHLSTCVSLMHDYLDGTALSLAAQTPVNTLKLLLKKGLHVHNPRLQVFADHVHADLLAAAMVPLETFC
jgi:hypothetical protein